MPTTIKINIQDLTPKWLANLKKTYQKADLEIKVVETTEQSAFNEASFWSIIGLLDWSKEEGILSPAIQQLATLSILDIYQFQNILAEKLYALDQQIFAQNIGSRSYNSDQHFSADSFLYARACVVANGQKFYETVLADPTKMPKEFTFEPLLYLAADAFKQKTGEDWTYLPEVSYETYSNTKGWNGKSWKDAILNP